MKLISSALSLFVIAALAVMWFHGKPEQQAARDLSEGDLFCMLRNVYHESRGEPLIGQAAVAHVTLNRVKSPLYPDSVWGVVWQKGQLSWTEDGRSDRMTDLDAIGKAVEVALAVARGKIKDPTGGALHDYAHEKVRPVWSKDAYRLRRGAYIREAGGKVPIEPLRHASDYCRPSTIHNIMHTTTPTTIVTMLMRIRLIAAKKRVARSNSRGRHRCGKSIDIQFKDSPLR